MTDTTPTVPGATPPACPFCRGELRPEGEDWRCSGCGTFVYDDELPAEAQHAFLPACPECPEHGGAEMLYDFDPPSCTVCGWSPSPATPASTDYLRRVAASLERVDWTEGSTGQHAIEEAADEIDRLRRNLTAARNTATQEAAGKVQAAAIALRHEATIKRLRGELGQNRPEVGHEIDGCGCGGKARCIEEETKGQWGKDGPRVKYLDRVYACACGERFYTPGMADRSTMQLLKATIVQLRTTVDDATLTARYEADLAAQAITAKDEAEHERDTWFENCLTEQNRAITAEDQRDLLRQAIESWRESPMGAAQVMFPFKEGGVQRVVMLREAQLNEALARVAPTAPSGNSGDAS